MNRCPLIVAAINPIQQQQLDGTSTQIWKKPFARTIMLKWVETNYQAEAENTTKRRMFSVSELMVQTVSKYCETYLQRLLRSTVVEISTLCYTIKSTGESR